MIVVDQAAEIGGRAATHVRQSVHFNLGPHALYRQGHAFRLFQELGVPFTGRVPSPGRGLLLEGGQSYPLPRGVFSLLGSRLFTLREKARLIRLLAKLKQIDSRRLDRVPLCTWVDEKLGSGKAAAFLPRSSGSAPTFSVHSAANLAPGGIAVVHAMKNLGGETNEPPALIEQELENLLDRIQPGWRERTVVKRYLPSMTVTHALPTAAENGLFGRPLASVESHPHVFLAGDWVGSEGLLADASAASAREAARRMLSVLTQPRAHSHRERIHVAI